MILHKLESQGDANCRRIQFAKKQDRVVFLGKRGTAPMRFGELYHAFVENQTLEMNLELFDTL